MTNEDVSDKYKYIVQTNVCNWLRVSQFINTVNLSKLYFAMFYSSFKFFLEVFYNSPAKVLACFTQRKYNCVSAGSLRLSLPLQHSSSIWPDDG